MGATISYTSYDYRPGTIVPVIASFDAEGHIKPLYVRIQGGSYKVASYHIKCRFSNTLEFNCQIETEHGTIPVLLSYHQAEGVWMLPGQAS